MDYTNINDYELIYMVKENNEDAFDMLFSKYQKVVAIEASKLFFVAKKVGLDMDDLIQEGNVGLINAFNKYQEEKGVLFYTLVILFIKRSIMTSIYRANSVSSYSLNSSLSIDRDSENGDLIDRLEGNDENPLLIIEREEVIKNIINFKNSLSDIESLIFELKYNCFSYEEISILLDISKKQVDNKLFNIRKKYKQSLNV